MTVQRADKSVHVGGTEVHYVEAGNGVPLLLLHGGLMSNDPVWEGSMGAYASRIARFAEHFRVIAPDLRGHGKTRNPDGAPISYSQLADDTLALIETLRLERPMLCGFSSGGSVAMTAAVRSPASVRAVVNDAGYDIFNPNPDAPTFVMCRKIFGGRPDATKADPGAFERFAAAQMPDFYRRLSADHVASQGPGGWKSLVAALFGALTSPGPYSFEDLRKIIAPTLILTGDRDFCCSVEEGVAAFRMLVKGELAILPNVDHTLPDEAIGASVSFLRRHANLQEGRTA
jgi:pimeloyl-ACP methyl ester carboxylesterase